MWILQLQDTLSWAKFKTLMTLHFTGLGIWILKMACCNPFVTAVRITGPSNRRVWTCIAGVYWSSTYDGSGWVASHPPNTAKFTSVKRVTAQMSKRKRPDTFHEIRVVEWRDPYFMVNNPHITVWYFILIGSDVGMILLMKSCRN